jgi:hypothetical protein
MVLEQERICSDGGLKRRSRSIADARGRREDQKLERRAHIELDARPIEW